MKQEIVSCDVCGKKREALSETWYKVKLSTGLDGLNTRGFVCEPYTESGSGKDACGGVCAMRLFDRWLEHEDLEERDPVRIRARSA